MVLFIRVMFWYTNGRNIVLIHISLFKFGGASSANKQSDRTLVMLNIKIFIANNYFPFYGFVGFMITLWRRMWFAILITNDRFTIINVGRNYGIGL